MRKFGVTIGWLCATPGLVMTASLIVMFLGFAAVPGCLFGSDGVFLSNGQPVPCPVPLLQTLLDPVMMVAAYTILIIIYAIIPILYSWIWVVFRLVSGIGRRRAYCA